MKDMHLATCDELAAVSYDIVSGVLGTSYPVG